jgi:pimeloyl-ACP methyl ester carboxylesterase
VNSDGKLTLTSVCTRHTLITMIVNLIIAPDLPGHGQSSWRSEHSSYHFVDWLKDLHDLLQALEWKECSVVAHSMGAAIASLWAGLFPEKCTSLILIEGLGPLTTPAEQTPTQLAKALQVPVYPFKTRSSLDELVTQRVKVTPMKMESAMYLMKRSTRITHKNQVQLCQDPKLRIPSLLRFTEEQVHAFLKRIQCKVLLIRADNGWPFDPQLIKERISCLSLQSH